MKKILIEEEIHNKNANENHDNKILILMEKGDQEFLQQEK